MSQIYCAALVAYDGSDYNGFQYQVDVPTVQGCLEQGLRSISTFAGRVVGSGRTDSGVHARGQVIAAEVPWKHGLDDLQRAWNAQLPSTIAIWRMWQAEPGFHPRFSAQWRTYRYFVRQGFEQLQCTLPRTSPLTDRYALYEPHVLDMSAMQAAAQSLVGTHDFQTFGQPPQGNKTVRHVVGAKWQSVASDLESLLEFPGTELVFTVTANAFLRHMVRNLVGSLLEVGRGNWTVDRFRQALYAADRKCSAPPAPPNGLVLERVTYPASMQDKIRGLAQK